ncbi:Shedu immune nuclease family protein [Flaviaesturariibacter aridisoli]|uniref:DUF4263 domain-containing protein n=1 Tax=Flaviaesturariibacter aridisoli TaxID=2545761 RepID=A0A4R4E1N7_9BACT|nr:Shedu immune nuclease family protein [Flaviaesturariibacter aridisoli]TCZ73279.1 DUF4263 domain-containing protein [Flaviaesturariibacter aridisoli]
MAALGSNNTNDEFLQNLREGFVYGNRFKNGIGSYFRRAFDEVTEQETGFTINVTSRIVVRATYISSNNEINGIELTKLDNGKTVQQISLTGLSTKGICEFLEFLTSADLKNLTGRFRVPVTFNDFDPEVEEAVRALCSRRDATNFLETLLKEDCVTSRDIVNTGYRKRSLNTFDRLVNEDDYWRVYAGEQGVSDHQEEKVIQHFLKNNPWIFGYGLDYRYLGIIQPEALLSNPSFDGSGGVITDFWMGDPRFTVFVELKRPGTSLFSSKNRSGSWRLSNELFWAVSQILEQKAAGTEKVKNTKYLPSGELNDQSAYDPKVILVIGRWKELNDASNPEEREIKRRTFELFRRDSRNIEILTFDELLERARFIAGSASSPELPDDDIQDLPF